MTARSLDIIMALGAALALLLGGFAGFAEECDEIPSEVLRLHIPANSDSAIDAFMKEIQPGETVNVCQAFSLKDMSPVTLQAVDAFGLDTSVTAVQTLNLQ